MNLNFFLTLICLLFLIVNCKKYSKPNFMKRNFPAADKNKDPILEKLKKHIALKKNGNCLEIASGSGLHICFFAKHFPNINFYPSEEENLLLNRINNNIQCCNLTNVKSAKIIDVKQEPEAWYEGKLKKKSFDYVYNCNMIHMVYLSGVEGLFRGSSYYLKSNGFLFTYGPYEEKKSIEEKENNSRDETSSVERESAMADTFAQCIMMNFGVRNIKKDLIPLAIKYNLSLVQKYDMPSTSGMYKLLIWKKIE